MPDTRSLLERLSKAFRSENPCTAPRDQPNSPHQAQPPQLTLRDTARGEANPGVRRIREILHLRAAYTGQYAGNRYDQRRFWQESPRFPIQKQRADQILSQRPLSHNASSDHTLPRWLFVGLLSGL